MIKLLQHARDWTLSPYTDGVATVAFDAWQSPDAKKADVSAPDATKPRATSLQNTDGLALRVPSALDRAKA